MCTMPELELLLHIPNEGKRSKAAGAALKRQGLRKGVPDLFLPVPRGIYPGLWIELKVGRNKPTKEQKWWLEKLQAKGYKCRICYSWEEAAETIKNYLKEEAKK